MSYVPGTAVRDPNDVAGCNRVDVTRRGPVRTVGTLLASAGKRPRIKGWRGKFGGQFARGHCSSTSPQQHQHPSLAAGEARALGSLSLLLLRVFMDANWGPSAPSTSRPLPRRAPRPTPSTCITTTNNSILPPAIRRVTEQASLRAMSGPASPPLPRPRRERLWRV